MSEDLSRVKDINISIQIWIYGFRLMIKNINHKPRFLGPFLKRLILTQFLSGSKAHKDVPIIINNYNRLSSLKEQVETLKKSGYHNIYIIDNNSSYPPLLEYYKAQKIKVFHLNKNVGFLSIWKTNIYEYFKYDFYVYTDSDIVPIKECPDDFILFFKSLLERYPIIDKAGFGLKIDDLPDHYHLKGEVLNHERKFWENRVEDEVYDAMIDTTFALYRPRKKGGYWLKSLRTGGKYMARHLPWYVNSSQLPEEELFYLKHAQASTHWTDMLKQNEAKSLENY